MKKFILTYVLAFAAIWASAQVATGLPYECSFEESEDLSCWTLNSGTPNASDKWMFGTAVHSEGKRAMYISADGQNPTYGKKNVVISMLRYKFPTSSTKQYYDISFDWKGVGNADISQMCLLVCREDELNTANGLNLNTLVSSTAGGIPNDILTSYGQLLGERGSERYYLHSSEGWQNVSITPDMNGNGFGVTRNNSQKNFVFIFVWTNSNTKDSIFNSSIAIDNFQINSGAVKKPQNLAAYPQCVDSSLLITWETTGAANSFDIQYRKTGESAWAHGVSGISDGSEGYQRQDGTHSSYSLKPILEGSYDIRIRSAYYDDQTGQVLRSNYAYMSAIFVYCPENHCINYVDLHSPNVTCYYGMNPNAESGHSPYDNIGVVDYGPDAIESRHTLHTDPTEVDPRTDSLLHTVPDGALASVRLGNWNWGGEAEAIEYNVLVDTTSQGILIAKYAIVFENPEGHDEAGQPVFKLEILDSNDHLIDEVCGQALFIFDDTDGAGWHMTRDNSAAWKEWTTVGLNLMDYHNQTIKVRFTTMDCGWSGHYAYAYFTVDCANAHIETENCGNDALVTCVAPEGFAYYWYKNGDLNDPAEHPYDQTLIVDATRTTYTCRVSFIEQPDCWFEISTTSEPRFPVPSYKVDSVFEGCESMLKFTNTSHVMNKWEGTENHTSESCRETLWTFKRLSDGVTHSTTQWSPTYKCPREGDSIEVTMTSYIGADNACDSTRVDTIVMPSILPQDSVLHMTTCVENPVNFDGKWFNADTVYTSVHPNFAGCDSTATLYLKVYPKPQDTYRHDSICSTQYVTVNGIKYNQPLDNYLIMLQTPNGCDSALYLTLTVNQHIEAVIPQMPYACADDEQLFITFDILAGVFDSLKITFSTPELRDTVIYDPTVTSIAIPYAENILPGHYSARLQFYQFCCGVYTEDRGFDIRYRSTIIEQKWNDVISLLSPKYNGGFEFTAFQWYKDGVPMEGENHSYIYQPLDFNASYYVELTRPDGVVMATCPIEPVYHEQQSDYPTIVKARQRVPMYRETSAQIWYFTISGQLYSTTSLPEGYGSLEVPDMPGVYVLKSVSSDGQTQAQVMIVE